MSLSDFISAAGKIAQNVSDFSYGYQKTGELIELLNKDRESGLDYIADLVKKLSPEQLDQYEHEDRHLVAYGIHDPGEKLRAMELYAWLKLMETAKYSKFRGFPS